MYVFLNNILQTITTTMFTISHGYFICILGYYQNNNEGTSVVPYFEGMSIVLKLHFYNYNE